MESDYTSEEETEIDSTADPSHPAVSVPVQGSSSTRPVLSSDEDLYVRALTTLRNQRERQIEERAAHEEKEKQDRLLMPPPAIPEPVQAEVCFELPSKSKKEGGIRGRSIVTVFRTGASKDSLGFAQYEPETIVKLKAKHSFDKCFLEDYPFVKRIVLSFWMSNSVYYSKVVEGLEAAFEVALAVMDRCEYVIDVNFEHKGLAPEPIRNTQRFEGYVKVSNMFKEAGTKRKGAPWVYTDFPAVWGRGRNCEIITWLGEPPAWKQESEDETDE